MKRKFLAAFLIAFLILGMVSVGYCSENRWGGVDRTRLLSKVVPGYLQSVGGDFTSGTSLTSITTAIPVSNTLVRKIITNDLTYRDGTLANGTKGQLLTIVITEIKDTAGDAIGTGSFVLTPTTSTIGFSSITFNAIADQVTLLYVDDVAGWIVIGSTNVEIVQFSD